jgi:hypothetical protein
MPGGYRTDQGIGLSREARNQASTAPLDARLSQAQGRSQHFREVRKIVRRLLLKCH